MDILQNNVRYSCFFVVKIFIEYTNKKEKNLLLLRIFHHMEE